MFHLSEKYRLVILITETFYEQMCLVSKIIFSIELTDSVAAAPSGEIRPFEKGQ
jgi:hypothetical protein